MAALAGLMAMAIISLVLPVAGAYPPAVHNKEGSVSGKVTSQSGAIVDNARVSIVNASNTSEIYAIATTDSTGHYSFSGVSATYDSASGKSIDGQGGMVYRIYALKSPYGDGYAGPFGLDASGNALNVNVIIFPRLTNITLSVSKITATMEDDRCAKVTAYVYDTSGQPAPDGVVVDFAVSEPGWTPKNGSLNKDGKQYASAIASGGKASVYYGWFPAGSSPSNNTVTASVHYFANIKASTDLYFPAAATVTPNATITPVPSLTVTPSPLATVTVAPTATPTPTELPTLTATIGQTQEPGSILVYAIIVIIVIIQIVGLFLGLRLLKKK